MIESKDLEKWRTAHKMRVFYDNIYNTINNDQQLKCEARLKDKKYLYKEFLEEYWPLLNFVELFYKGQDVKCRYVGRQTQNTSEKYDGEVRMRDGTIEKIEITVPRDGELEKKQAEQLNSRGVTNGEVWEPFEKYEEVAKIIVDCAEKKGRKCYSGVTLVICFEFFLYIDPTSSDGVKMIEQIINNLKSISYSAKSVYFMISPYKSSSVIFGGAIYKVK